MTGSVPCPVWHRDAGAGVMLWFIHSFPTLICGLESPPLQQHSLHRDTGSQRKDGITLMYASWFLRAHNKKPQTTTKNITQEEPLFLCCCSCKNYSQRGDKITSAQPQQSSGSPWLSMKSFPKLNHEALGSSFVRIHLCSEHRNKLSSLQNRRERGM